jgi:hypothetical protein
LTDGARDRANDRLHARARLSHFKAQRVDRIAARRVTLTIPGDELPDEVVVVGGHLDGRAARAAPGLARVDAIVVE